MYPSVVVVHGVYGGWDDRTLTNPGSGTSSWVVHYTQSLNSDSRILRFKYNASRILAGPYTRAAVRKRALRLLDDLLKLRKNEPEVYRQDFQNRQAPADMFVQKRSIMFVAHDIGGIIVKDVSRNQAAGSTIRPRANSCL
jgi:hypothetical protein